MFGARALLVRALPDPPGALADAGARRAEALRHAARALAERADRLQERVGDRPQVTAAIGSAAAVILEAAEARAEPTLIAVGHRGAGLIDRLRLGSVSTKVLHAAPGPVLIVPAQPR